MARARNSATSGRTERLTLIIAATAGAIGVLAGVYVIWAPETPTRTIALGVVSGVAGVAVSIATVLTLRYLGRVQRVDFRIAITGVPQAGKTVFATILYDVLVDSSTSEVNFTPESQSIIAVYQAIRGITADRWPASTRTGSVFRYEGTIRFGRRLEVDLEIGDSAGEYWIDLEEPSGKNGDYLSYVVSSDAITHVIPVDRLLDAERSDIAPDAREFLRRDLRDLKFASNLISSAKRGPAQRPLLVVISKMDLLNNITPAYLRDNLLQTIPVSELASYQFFSSFYFPGRSALKSELANFGEEVQQYFSSVDFVFSSVSAITEKRSPRTVEGGVMDWLRRASVHPGAGVH